MYYTLPSQTQDWTLKSLHLSLCNPSLRLSPTVDKEPVINRTLSVSFILYIVTDSYLLYFCIVAKDAMYFLVFSPKH